MNKNVFGLLAGLVVAVFVAGSVFAQTTPSPTPLPSPTPAPDSSGYAGKVHRLLDAIEVEPGGYIAFGSTNQCVLSAAADGYLKVSGATLFTGSLNWGGTSTGTTTALVLSPVPNWTALGAGQTVTFLSHTTVTGATTVAISGLTAKSIIEGDASALDAGDIVEGVTYSLIYNGTAFQLK